MSEERPDFYIAIYFLTDNLLGLAFVVLKLCKVIDWSWLWITAPFWGWFALALAMVAIPTLFALLADLIRGKK